MTTGHPWDNHISLESYLGRTRNRAWGQTIGRHGTRRSLRQSYSKVLQED